MFPISVRKDKCVSALHKAVKWGLHARAKKLIQRGVSLEALTADHKTPLQLALEVKDFEMVKILVFHGANIHLQGTYGKLIHFGVLNSHEKFLKHILKDGADTVDEIVDGKTPLEIAIRKKDLNIVKILIKHGADILRDTANEKLFHLAVLTNSQDILDYFFREKVDVNQKNHLGDTALHLICREADSNYSVICQLLLSCGADVNATNQNEETPLLCAVKNRLNSIIPILLKSKINKNSKGNKLAFRECLEQYPKIQLSNVYGFLKSGFTLEKVDAAKMQLLADAIEHDCSYIVEKMLNLGFNVNSTLFGITTWTLNDPPSASTAFQSWNLLQIACKSGSRTCIQLLLKHGANAKTKFEFERTPMFLAVKSLSGVACIEELCAKGADFHQTSKSGGNILHFAASVGDKEVVEFFLDLKIGVDNRMNHGATALHCAAFFGFFQVIQTLLRHGASIDVIMFKELTALHLAVMQGSMDSALILQSFGVDVNVQDAWGRTPLHIALAEGHRELITFLLMYGANLMITDNFGLIAFDYVKDVQHAIRNKCANLEIRKKFALELFNDERYANSFV